MINPKISTKSLVISSIIAGILFYIVFFSISKWFKTWTGYSFRNDWVIVLVSAIPLLILLIFMLGGSIKKATIGGIEFEFDKELPPKLIESVSLDMEVARDFLLKGRREELENIVRNLSFQTTKPTILLIPLSEKNTRIHFNILREYIYRLSEVAPIEYIVFVDYDKSYLGFSTVSEFKSRYPRFGLELIVDDLLDEKYRRMDIPPIFSNLNLRSVQNALDILINEQWITNYDPQRGPAFVRISHLPRLGASNLKIKDLSTPSNAYWLMVENNLDGLPVVDHRDRFIGIVTKDKISQAVILQLLQRNNPQESEK